MYDMFGPHKCVFKLNVLINVINYYLAVKIINEFTLIFTAVHYTDNG